MSHRVHPLAFRMKSISDWKTRGFYGKKFGKYLAEDYKIRTFLKEKIGKFGIEKVEIERFHNKLKVIIYTARPGLVIGRAGQGVELLKNSLEKNILDKKDEKEAGAEKIRLLLEIKEVKNPWASAPLSAFSIAQQIEKRMHFRRVLKQALQKIMEVKEIEGCRVQVSGRLNGVDISRTEWLMKGKLPRQTIRADIGYGTALAICSYGVIGVKVWTYKGERFEDVKQDSKS